MILKKWFINFLEKKETIKTDSINEDKEVEDLMAEVVYKELALYTAITLIANSISKCEIKTYEAGVEVKEKLYYSLNVSPNLNQNSSQFWHKVIEKMIYDSEALVLDINDKLYCADSYGVDKYPILGNKYTGVMIENLQLEKTFYTEGVLLFKLDNVHLKKFIDALNLQYGKLISYAMKKYKESGQTKYKLKLDYVKAGDEKFNEIFDNVIKKQIKSFIESDKAVYPEYEGQSLEDISPKDNNKYISDIKELRKEIMEIVSQTFKIPMALMSGNITNIQDIVKMFLTFCIDPIADMISEELTRKIHGFEDWKNGRYIKVDTSTINHIDMFDVAEKVDKLISSGTNCIDEVRKALDYPELNTEFSKTHFITKNYDTMENRLKGEEDNK